MSPSFPRRPRRASRPVLEELEPRLPPASDFFVVPGAAGEPVAVRFNWLRREAVLNNEIGFYRVEDEAGRVGGLLPGQAGYAQAALSSAQVVFRSGQGAGAANALTFTAGDRLAFYLVPNNNRAAVLNSNPQNVGGGPIAFFSVDGANPDGVEHVQSAAQTDGGLRLAFEDMAGGGDFDFNDAVLSVGGSGLLTTPGQAGQSVQATFTFSQREAAYRSEVGLYKVDDASGRVGGVAPGSAGYAQAVMSAASRQVLFGPGDEPGATRTVTLEGGARYAFYLIADATAGELMQGNPTNTGSGRPFAFFSVAAANSDGAAHADWVSPGVLGFEDLPAGDFDFNDVLIAVQFGAPTGTPPPPVDTTPPAPATFTLAPESDTGDPGDLRTGLAEGNLIGTAEAGATVELRRVDVPGTRGNLLQTTTADASGSFRFDDVPFTLGGNGLGVVVVDRAANRSAIVEQTIVRAQAPTVTAGDIPDQNIPAGQTRTFNLLDVFDTLARFEAGQGNIDINLFEDREITVENFLSYVNNATFDGNYNDSIFHRLDKGFVLQGGGFKFNAAGTTTATKFPEIDDFGEIQNEPGISNTQYTIAMAKLGGDPDSATSEFFFNLANNTGLDSQNGGFTVFGRVTTASEPVVDQIEDTFQEFNGPGLPGAAPFPVRPGANTTNFPTNITAGDLARIFRAVTLTDARSLTFSTPVSTAPGVATASIAANTLTVLAVGPGTTTISFTATDPDGLSFTVQFGVTVP
jgi:cyclophilin family peptidyl-prolyl cis-trans isomerase